MVTFPKFTGNSFYLIVIAVLVVVIIFLRSCGPGPEIGEPIITTTIDTVYVDKPIEKKVYVPAIKIKVPGDPIYIIEKADTAAILKEYFSKNVYEDKIQLDSFGYILVRDTISENKITSRITEGKYTIPTINKTTTIQLPYKPKTQVYAGIDIAVGSPAGLTYFGPRLILKTKKDQMYAIGAGFNPAGGLQYQFGTAWKIKLHK